MKSAEFLSVSCLDFDVSNPLRPLHIYFCQSFLHLHSHTIAR